VTLRSRERALIALPLGLLIGAGVARGADIVIANGSAPPDPANVLGAGNSSPQDRVAVQSVGCNFLVEYPCAAPGAATEVLVVGGAWIGDLAAFESSSVTMDGGTIERNLEAFNFSHVTLNDGQIRDFVQARDFAKIDLTGGAVGDNCEANGASEITLDGGSIDGFLLAFEQATIVMRGGVVARNLAALNFSTVTLSGGEVMGIVEAFDFATATVRGGAAADIEASGASIVTLEGGTGVAQLVARQEGAIQLVGAEFRVDGALAAYGPIPQLSGGITGRLASGDSLDAAFLRQDEGAIVLASELDPLLGAGAAGLTLTVIAATARRGGCKARR
jgi:hypothetical protein